MIRHFILHPATFKLDGGAMFGIIPKPLWEKQIPSDELNRIQLSLRVLCIKTKNRVILIDTGIGDYHDEKFSQRFAIVGQSEPLLQLLANELQIQPDHVTDVVVTHLHFDHAGGLCNKRGQFIFPRATMHLHRSHFDYALGPTARDIGSFQKNHFLPVVKELDEQQRIHWHQGETGELCADGEYRLMFRCSHGHTPWLLHPYDHRFIYLADLVPTAAHIPIPWVMGYDIAPGQTTKDKSHIYQFIRENNLTIIFEHDLQFWGGKLGESDQLSERFIAPGTSSHEIS